MESLNRAIVGMGILPLVIGLSACTPKKEAVVIETDEQKYSYAIGYNFANNLKNQNLKVDVEALAEAVEHVMAGKEPALSQSEMEQAMQNMYKTQQEQRAKEAEVNMAAGVRFLEQNSEKEGVQVTDSGLQYKVVEPGEGTSPRSGQMVSVHYRGTLIDGSEFDSSYRRNEPAQFPVDGVIPGWVEALKMMKPGAKWELYIPAELAYGERGRPGIPPNSVLIFEVELLQILGQ